MTTIIVMHDEQDVDEFDFPNGTDSVTLGRRPSNDVCISDRSVSGTHARLSFDDDGAMIEDLGSTNGTYVNGRPVQRCALEPSDELLIGKVRLQVVAEPVAGGRRAGDKAPISAMASAPAAAHAADLDDDDDELDESMRAALALYSEDPVEEDASPAFVDEDDDIDFSEDARLFAQNAAPLADEADASASFVEDDDRLPTADDSIDFADEADTPLTLSARAKAALGREAPRPRLHAVPSGSARGDAHAVGTSADGATAAHQDELNGHAAVAERPAGRPAAASPTGAASTTVARDPVGRARAPAAHPLDGLEDDSPAPMHDLDRPRSRSRGAVIEIKNGAKSGQILPIDKPVTTLGRPGIQIAAIMRKPDGYFLMHIESDDSVERPTLNTDSIGDEPVLLHSGDELNVAGIDVEFMLS